MSNGRACSDSNAVAVAVGVAATAVVVGFIGVVGAVAAAGVVALPPPLTGEDGRTSMVSNLVSVNSLCLLSWASVGRGDDDEDGDCAAEEGGSVGGFLQSGDEGEAAAEDLEGKRKREKDEMTILTYCTYIVTYL